MSRRTEEIERIRKEDQRQCVLDERFRAAGRVQTKKFEQELEEREKRHRKRLRQIENLQHQKDW